MKSKWIANFLADMIHTHSRFHIRAQAIIKWLEKGNMIWWKRVALCSLRGTSNGYR